MFPEINNSSDNSALFLPYEIPPCLLCSSCLHERVILASQRFEIMFSGFSPTVVSFIRTRALTTAGFHCVLKPRSSACIRISQYSTMSTEPGFHALKADLPAGDTYDFAQLKGKTVLVVNVASQWYVYNQLVYGVVIHTCAVDSHLNTKVRACTRGF